jgi:hypothetical protein
VAAMEKQVRDLTTNLEELTRQNQVLNQKLLQMMKGRKRRTKGRTRREMMPSLDKNKRQERR